MFLFTLQHFASFSKALPDVSNKLTQSAYRYIKCVDRFSFFLIQNHRCVFDFSAKKSFSRAFTEKKNCIQISLQNRGGYAMSYSSLYRQIVFKLIETSRIRWIFFIEFSPGKRSQGTTIKVR